MEMLLKEHSIEEMSRSETESHTSNLAEVIHERMQDVLQNVQLDEVDKMG